MLSSKSLLLILNAVWLVLKRLAMISAQSVSSKYLLSEKPTEKVFSFCVNCEARPVTIDESIPPLRKQPNGTSAINLRCTDADNNSRSLFFAVS